MKSLNLFLLSLQRAISMKLVESIVAVAALILLLNALSAPLTEIMRLKKVSSTERYELYLKREQIREGGHVEK
jgi:hypothetical protein